MMRDDRPVSDDDLHAYVDGFLDAAGRARVERHIAAHPDAHARLLAWQDDAAALRRVFEPKLREPVPASLSLNTPVGARRRMGWPGSAVAAGIAAAFVLGTGAGWLGRGSDEPHGLTSLARQAATAQRVFAATPPLVGQGKGAAALPVGYDSSNAGRIVHAPDLSAAGYTLVGARLVPTEQGSAAFFVYRNRNDQRLGVMARLMIGIDTHAPLRPVPLDGSTGYAWSRDGLGFSVVSGAGTGSIRFIAERLRDQTVGRS